MTDKLASLVDDFRFWRSSVPTGLLIAFLGALALLTKWPVLAHPQHWVKPELWPLVSSIPSAAWLLIGLALASLIGSWWCGFTTALAVWTARAGLSHAPLERPPEDWSRAARLLLALTLPIASVRDVRSRMALSSDYRDLLPEDRRGAFTNFMKAAITPDAAVRGSDAAGLERTLLWTDLRLSCGLVGPLPIAIWFAPQFSSLSLSGLRTMTVAGAIIVLVVLAIETVVRLRRVLQAAVEAALDGDFLGHCARAAIDSGRSTNEVDAAEARVR